MALPRFDPIRVCNAAAAQACGWATLRRDLLETLRDVCRLLPRLVGTLHAQAMQFLVILLLCFTLRAAMRSRVLRAIVSPGSQPVLPDPACTLHCAKSPRRICRQSRLRREYSSTAALLAAAVEYSRERWRCLRIDSIQPATTGVQRIHWRRVRHAPAAHHGMQCIAWRGQVHCSPDPHEVVKTVRAAGWHGLRCVLRIACCAGRVLAATSVASCLLYFIIRGSPTRRLGVPTSRHTGATSTRMRRRRALRTADVLQTTRSIQRAAYNTRAACITLAACTTEHNSLQHAPKRCLPLCAAGWRRRRRWSSVRP